MLRAARQQQGLHIAALAASIKVAPAKLEALESGRYHELLDLTFTRALAQAICRVLKIDPAPVLAQLPDVLPDGLGRVGGGLNTPFRERPGRVVPADWVPWRHPVLWLVALLLLAAVAFVLVPSTSVRDLLPGESVSKPAAADGVALPGLAARNTAEVAPAASADTPPVTSAAAGASVTKGDVIVVRALKPTWIQATDGGGQTLISRLVSEGETVELTGKLPLRLKVGNVSGTELKFRGKLVDLGAATRDNTASLTLP
jgi:cytoskeleton protein RodZ